MPMVHTLWGRRLVVVDEFPRAWRCSPHTILVTVKELRRIIDNDEALLSEISSSLR